MDMTTLLIAVLGFVMVGGLGFVFAGGDNGSAKAVKRAQGLRVQTSSKLDRRSAKTSDPAQRRKQILLQLKEAERRQRKAHVSLRAKLQQTGLSVTPLQFWIGSLVLGMVVMALAAALMRNPLIAVAAGFVAGLGLPRWLMSFIGKRRTKKFTASFADAVDIIVRGIKSGLPVHDCLKIIARETEKPLSIEFTKLVENIGMGMELNIGLEKMYERMPTSELRFFTIVLAIQAKTGGNLAEALANLSVVLRARRLMREKIKALSSEATASAGIIGSLPPAVMLMVSVTTPSYMALMFTDSRGNLMLLGSVIWMSLGIFVMKRMISFKI
jgi:tight adherence protein B